ncbi:MAG: hypothetical protein AMXMBFR84_35130 [Candidatus Hydrogenedentota bacterium]
MTPLQAYWASALTAHPDEKDVCSEIERLASGPGHASRVRQLVGMLSVLPGPIKRNELVLAAIACGTGSKREQHEVEKGINDLLSRDVAESSAAFVEMTWTWKQRISGSQCAIDQAVQRAGAHYMATAALALPSSAAPLAWSYAPRFLAAAQRFVELRDFCLSEAHFKNMISVAPEAIAVPVWCSGIATLIERDPSAAAHWRALAAPVLPRVFALLESQYAPNGWLCPVVHDLATSAAAVPDNVLFDEFFRIASGDGVPERGALALVQLFCEAGDYDRAIRLARAMDARYATFNTAHFLALALLEHGRNQGGKNSESSLQECIRIEQTRSQTDGAAHSMSFQLRRSVLARAHHALYRIYTKRRESEVANMHRNQALFNIEGRYLERKNVQVSGYRAEIHLEIGELETAWWTASNTADRSVASIEAGGVLLALSSTDPFGPRFVPYCRQQAVAWMLAHCPYGSTGSDERIETVVRWALRERVWPMAIAADPKRTESLAPGVFAACAHAKRPPERARIGTHGGVLDLRVDRWDIAPADGPPCVVVGVAEYDVVARGVDFDAAISNLERVLYLITNETRYDSWHQLPIVAQLGRWVAAHTDETSVPVLDLIQLSDNYQKGRFVPALDGIRASIDRRSLQRPRAREEFDRLQCWIGAEAGDTEAIAWGIRLFDWPTAAGPHYTDLQKAGCAIGLVPHPIVKRAHEQFEALQLAPLQRGFTAIERLYFGLYLLGQEENSRAEEVLCEALTLETSGLSEKRVIARIGDSLAEVLRRRGDVPRAIQILDENIAYREEAGVIQAPSYLQRAKCQHTERDALRNLRIAQSLMERFHPKELVRALLVEARIISDSARQEEILGTVLRTASHFPGVRDDPKFQQIVERWEDWRRPSFSPELSYWGL